MSNDLSVSWQDFWKAANKAGIPDEQISEMWSELRYPESLTSSAASMQAATPIAATGSSEVNWGSLLAWTGGIIVMLGMLIFAASSWDTYGPKAGLLTSLVYLLVFSAAAEVWHRRNMLEFSGLSACCALVMIPVTIYMLERVLGVWGSGQPATFSSYHEQIRAGWVSLEVATLVGSVFMLKRYKFNFIAAPIAFTLWYLSMDLAPLLFGKHISGEQRALVSLVIGLAIILASLYIDQAKNTIAQAIWGYIFGGLSYAGALIFLVVSPDAGMTIWLPILLIAAAGCVAGLVYKDSVLAAIGGSAAISITLFAWLQLPLDYRAWTAIGVGAFGIVFNSIIREQANDESVKSALSVLDIIFYIMAAAATLWLGHHDGQNDTAITCLGIFSLALIGWGSLQQVVSLQIVGAIGAAGSLLYWWGRLDFTPKVISAAMVGLMCVFIGEWIKDHNHNRSDLGRAVIGSGITILLGCIAAWGGHQENQAWFILGVFGLTLLCLAHNREDKLLYGIPGLSAISIFTIWLTTSYLDPGPLTPLLVTAIGAGLLGLSWLWIRKNK